jgi:nucleoid-associated protein YgaU
MQLWNDYEGKTIADTYSLGPLLRPEGRSALFALPKGEEAPAVIRLTESIDDEGQILASWKRVSEVHQENLVAIKRFGETTFEGTPLTYAVMEPADANLADLLKERPLTQAEAMQVATSVVAAISTLHAQGLIHEHIDASHVVAVGETVKLRTDCVREWALHPDDATPENRQKLIQRDVHDLATLLLRVLTLETTLKPGLNLPAPFDRIINNGISGAWGLDEISAVLTPPAPAARAAAATPQLPTAAAAAAPTAEPVPAALAGSAIDPLHYQRRIHNSTVRVHPRMKLWGVLGAVAVVIVLVLLRGISSSPRGATQAAENAPATSKPIRQMVTRPAPAVVATAPSAATRQPLSTSQPAAAPQAAASTHLQPGWYVVAYTFNRIGDAARRAEAIAQRNPGLHPQVIAPYGGRPFLVALGGPMTRPDAESIQRRARQSGLPRDTFVRNYKGN